MRESVWNPARIGRPEPEIKKPQPTPIPLPSKLSKLIVPISHFLQGFYSVGLFKSVIVLL